VLLAVVLFLGLKEVLPSRIFPEAPTANANIVVDSLMLEALLEEENYAEQEQTKDTIPGESMSIETLEKPQPTSTHKYLTHFFEKLYQLEEQETTQVRIAYFGDSMTDGDYIVQDLRRFFQEEFGGKGVGFVSITSESAASRGSIRHSYSNNWHTQSYVNVKQPSRPFGVNGHVFFANDTLETTWVEYKASYQKNVNELHNPILFYGKSDNKEAYVELFYDGDTAKVVKPLYTDDKLNTV